MLAMDGTKPERKQRGLIRLISCLMVGIFLLTSAGISYGFDSVKKAGPFEAGAFIDIDTDGDMLGDFWEIKYFGSLNVVNDPYGDYDNDSYTNLWEFQNGTDPTDPGDPNYYIAAKNKALMFLMSMMDKRLSSGKRISYSYVDAGGNTDGYGWTYDNALSVMALEEAGEWQRAKDILDAFIWFQDRDPEADGRIRRAYWANTPIDDFHTGDCSGWIPATNSEASNQSVGDMAFMILAALRYHEYIGEEDSVYLNFAKKLGDWIFNNAESDSGAGGYNMARMNFELADPANYDRKSTENNIDAYVAFMKLYECLNDHKYRIYALYAKNFVLAMWNSTAGMFWTGTLNDGITINGGVDSDVVGYDGIDPTSGQPEDTNTWGMLALGEVAKYEKGIDWVEDKCKVVNMDGFKSGYDFNADRDGIWFEGMSHMALSYQMLGDDARQDEILNVILGAQDNNSGGVMCASHDGVTTSFTLWTLSTDLHIAPTAWLIFAVDKYNPFWSAAITDAVPYEGGYNESGDAYTFEEPWVEASVASVAQAQDGTMRAIVGLDGEGGDDKGTLVASDDGIIVKYEWDFDGKGTYDWSSTINAAVSYWYTEAGVHLARLRVTNDKGYVSTKGVTVNISQADLGAGASAPVVSNVSVSSVSGTAPFTVSFTGDGADADGNVANYQWDFDGNGEYDSYSESSGNVTYTYREAGAYQPTLKITDNDGLTDTASVAVEVLPSSSAPTAKASVNTLTGLAPHAVDFYAVGSLDNIIAYEWDFEGDGVYDWISSSESVASYSYGEPGTYIARLRVTNASGIVDTDTVKIRVEYNGSISPPEAIGSADPQSGIVPFIAKFSQDSSVGYIAKYEWDFDNDKSYDWSSNKKKPDAEYEYTRPGYYLAVLRVTDNNGLSHRAYAQVTSTMDNQAGALYGSTIKEPKKSKKIAGNAVAFIVKISPKKKGQDIGLQLKLSTEPDTAWHDAGAFFNSAYKSEFDTTALPEGDYDFRAPVNGNSKKAKVSSLTIDQADWDMKEYKNSKGEREKREKIKKNEYAEIELFDGTMCMIDAGTFDDDCEITIKAANGTRVLLSTGVDSIAYHREFSSSCAKPFKKSVTIIIPYEDADDNGVVDGLGINENEMKMYYYNEASSEWEALPDFTVYPDDNYVSGRVGHFSLFGIGSAGGAAGLGAAGAVSALGGGRSCFIATATYGTPMADEVQLLRFFRDNYMLTNAPGEFLIDMYEKYSPPIAKRIEKSGFLKGLIRYYLRPVITFARWANVITGSLCRASSRATCEIGVSKEGHRSKRG